MLDDLYQETHQQLRSIGLELEQKWVGNVKVLRSAEFDKNNGFQIEFVETSHQFGAIFSLENFAGLLAQSIRNEIDESSRAVKALESKVATSAELRVKVNGTENESLVAALDSPVWNDLSIEMWLSKPIKSGVFASNASNLAGLVLSILPLEDAPGDVEGAARMGAVTSFERSEKNRLKCIQIFGYSCQACNVLLEQVYGEIGKNFIHVHHTTPVSQMDQPKRLDPGKDLVPLCPNCHYIAHRRNPPLSLEEIRAALNR